MRVQNKHCPTNANKTAKGHPNATIPTHHVATKPARAQPTRRSTTRSEVDNLVDVYATGINVRHLAAAFGINRDTALRHLQRRDVPSRAAVRMLTDERLAAATRQYLAGEPMAKVCDDLAINPTTLRRALTKTGIQLRRPGRPGTGTTKGLVDIAEQFDRSAGM